MPNCSKCNDTRVKIPSVGEDIYVPTFDDYGFIGGLAKVKQVIENSMIFIEEWSDISLNWQLLEPYQSELREKFGLQRAYLASDFEEKQKKMSNCCPLKNKSE